MINERAVGIVYMYFRKAFDKDPLSWLIQKVKMHRTWSNGFRDLEHGNGKDN